MGYSYSNFQIKNVDSQGNDLIPAQNLTIIPFPSPTVILNACIGNRIILSFNLDAFGGDTFINKKIRVNISPFLGNDQSNALDFGFESIGFIDPALTDGFFIGNGTQFSNPLVEKNINAKFRRVSNVQAFIEVEFFMTCDIAKFLATGGTTSTLDRFLKAITNQPNLINGGSAVYNQQKELGLKVRVFNNNTSFISNVLNQINGDPVIKIPFQGRFYNSFTLNNTSNTRYLKAITATTPTQLLLSLPNVLSASASGPQLVNQNIDSTFLIASNSVSPTEKNTFSVIFEGLANPSTTPNPATTDIRILLIKVDPISNTTDFITDLKLKESIIPSLDASTTQLDGAIFTPSSWSDAAGNTTVLSFDLDGAFLELGATYRIIFNLYDSANSQTTTHISPEFSANYTLPVIPNIEGFISTYNKEYTGNQLSNVAPHSRFKSKLIIDKTDYNTKLSNLGLSGSFDDYLSRIKCELTAIGIGDVDQIGEYKPNTLAPPLDNTIITNNFKVISDTSTELIVECIFRVEEEKAGQSQDIRWFIEFNQIDVSGGFVPVSIRFFQEISFGDFENDKATPLLVNANVYDSELYPTEKVLINDICNKDNIIVEVERDSVLLAGAVNFAATIYPADSSGNTTVSSIEEREDWTPATQQLEQLFSPKIGPVEISFVGDFAFFKVNVLQLTIDQLYFITGLAYQQIPDYCTLISFVQNIDIKTGRTTLTPSGWTVETDATNFENEITGNPFYIGGLNYVYNRIVDNLGNVLNFQSSTPPTLAAQNLDQSLSSVFYELRIDAEFDAGAGVHILSHVLRFEIPIPPINSGSTTYSINTYSCTDLG